MKQFIERSLRGLVQGTVQLGGRHYDYCQWDGENLAGRLIGFDTETECLDSAAAIPRLAVATAFDGTTVFLVRPEKLGNFVRQHARYRYVVHNCAFDYHVVREHLWCAGDRAAARLWLKILDSGRLGDSMLLDQLISLARGHGYPRPRNLAQVARQWAQIPDLDKGDPYRTRFGEIIDVRWRAVDPCFWQYAARDPIATYLAYKSMRQFARAAVARHKIDSNLVNKYGSLTWKVQTKAAVALAAVTRNGICLDPEKRSRTRDRLSRETCRLIKRIARLRCAAGVFKRHKATRKLQLTATGKPRTDMKRLGQILVGIARDHDIVVPLTLKTGKPTTARSFWEQHVDVHPFISAWIRLDELTKLSQFFARLDADRVHPQYATLVRSGRVSCSRPNIQQIPRSSDFREIFVPSPGHLFLTIDYSALELRTLAAECERRYGRSHLAEIIRDGLDPHAYTAALLLDLTLDEFLDLKTTDPGRFKQYRQQAKALNFGLPAGLSAKTLVTYASLNYGVALSHDEACAFRDKFLSQIYPEIGRYLESDVVDVLARNLHVATHDVRWEFDREEILIAVRNVVRGEATKRDGEPYSPKFVRLVWESLELLNRNPRLESLIMERRSGEVLERRLFSGPITTSTGRIRGGANFTQRRNTPFQGMAADGAKLALWGLAKAGYRVVAFIHDEFLIELPEDADHTQEARRIERICCRSMEKVTGTVPVACEYSLSRRWSKQAEAVFDNGQLVLWGAK